MLSKNGGNARKMKTRGISVDMPWLLSICFLVGFATDTLPRFEDKKEMSSSPSQNIIQLEVNLSTKETGKYMVFKGSSVSSQGAFKSVAELRGEVNKIDRGFIDTDNMGLSLGDLENFKRKLSLPNVKIHHVR